MQLKIFEYLFYIENYTEDVDNNHPNDLHNGKKYVSVTLLS